jgi:ComF family protein
MNVLQAPPPYPRPGRVEQCLDLLFPPMCVECRRVGRWICPKCWKLIAWAHSASCGACGTPSIHNPCRWCTRPTSPVRAVVAVAPFEGIVREAVHALKYEGRHAISSTMGKLMAGSCRELKGDLVVPTPLHVSRRRERGYDQAALLARAIARELGLPSNVNALKRTRRTRQQVALGPEERRKNVAGAFTAPPQRAETVLLVDDVYTTGATMDAAASALLRGGARSVIGVVFGYAEVGHDSTERRSGGRSVTSSRPGRSTR